jgi:DNA-binding NtrC family response regulator
MNAIPRVLIVDDEQGAREALRMVLKDDYEIFLKEESENIVEEVRRLKVDLMLLDVIMPGIDGLEALRQIRRHFPELPVIMVTATKNIRTAVTAMKLGAQDFVNKPFDIEEIRVVVKRAIASIGQKGAPAEYSKEWPSVAPTIVGDHPKIKEVLKTIHKLKETDSTVLITGESGTGKELVARCLQSQGARSKGPFIAFNCACLSEELMESELFGHEKGAFTGAIAQKKGMFELAHQGTLFLDEVTDTSLSLQGRLLRVLQEKEFRRVGGNQLIKVDVRLIAATNQDLKAAVKEGKFREDLYYRLSVVPVYTPPLRERKEDIPRLVNHFLQQFKKKIKTSVEDFSDQAMDCLMRYDWPGNVREMQNVIEHLIVMMENPIVMPIDLPPQIRIAQALVHVDGPSFDTDYSMEGTVSKYERDMIQDALRKNRGILTSTADYLGTTRRILKYKMDKLGILVEKGSYQSGQNN